MDQWIRPQDIWKFGTIVGLICGAVATNAIGLPHLLLPYKEWFEFGAGISSVVLAYHMKKPE